MDTSTTLLITLVGLSGSVVGAVVSAWFARESRRVSAAGTVDELAAVVQKVAATQRRETMRRVRAAAPDVQAGLFAGDAPPELVAPQTAAGPVSKDQLRRQLLRRVP
jgi:cob(I)alamin adenosyltransferase